MKNAASCENQCELQNAVIIGISNAHGGPGPPRPGPRPPEGRERTRNRRGGLCGPVPRRESAGRQPRVAPFPREEVSTDWLQAARGVPRNFLRGVNDGRPRATRSRSPTPRRGRQHRPGAAWRAGSGALPGNPPWRGWSAIDYPPHPRNRRAPPMGVAPGPRKAEGRRCPRRDTKSVRGRRRRGEAVRRSDA